MSKSGSWKKCTALGFATLLCVTARNGDSVAAAPTELSRLLQRFSALPGLQANFREQKRIALLIAPLSSSGRIHFAPPATLLRFTLEPEQRALLLDRSQLQLVAHGNRRAIDTQSNPALRMLTSGWLDLLRGDLAALERNYTVSFSRQRGRHWRLELKPRAAPLTKMIRSIAFRGHDIAIQQMRVVDSNGDETITTFRDTNTTKHYASGELPRKFEAFAKELAAKPGNAP